MRQSVAEFSAVRDNGVLSHRCVTSSSCSAWTGKWRTDFCI